MDNSSNNDFYGNTMNEANSSINSGAIKWGSTLILVLGIISLIGATAIAFSLREFLTPLDWVVLLLDSIILIVCGFFARRGQTWAFIVPIVIYAIMFIQTIIAGEWLYVILRASIVVSLGIALKKVLDQKRAAKEEAWRQTYQ
ncbi:MAG TPA: hypothetical protein PKY64_08700 [Anaerolineaceae bacterium]|nr:hypothetical protein [Anaerolineaceae bacterium]